MYKTKLLAADWSYPVCQYPKEVRGNLRAVISNIKMVMGTQDLQIVGYGASGHMLLMAFGIESLAFNYYSQFSYFPIYKDCDETTIGRDAINHIKPNTKIIILDDHIVHGRTLERLAIVLRDKMVIQNVVGVIAKAWCDDSDETDHITQHEVLVQKLFQNIKWWIY